MSGLHSRHLRIVATVLVLGVAAKVLLDAAGDWSLSDMDAYWNAALRLRAGDPLYGASYSVGAHDLYRYAPWFAYLWVPLTYLPRGLVAVVWEAVLLGATVASVVPTLRRRTWAATLLGVLMSAFLLWTVAKANAHPLVVAAVVLSGRNRWGPLGIALAASLKAAPLAYVAIYVGRREWRRAAWTLLLTAALVLPMLFFNVSDYPAGPGLSLSLFYSVSPGAWVAAAIVAFLAAIWHARTRWAWIAGSIATIAAFPRLLDYDLSFLLVASSADANGGPEGVRAPDAVMPAAATRRPAAEDRPRPLTQLALGAHPEDHPPRVLDRRLLDDFEVPAERRAKAIGGVAGEDVLAR